MAGSSAFYLPEGLGSHSLTMWFKVGDLSYVVSTQLERLDINMSHMNRQSCLQDGAPVKILNTKTWMSFPGWQDSVHAYCHTVMPGGSRHTMAILHVQGQTTAIKQGSQ